MKEENKRADAGRRYLGLFAPRSYSPIHKTTALNQASLGGDLEPWFIRNMSDKPPRSKICCIYEQKKRRDKICEQKIHGRIYKQN
jgi:hypothetical protein